MILGDYATFEKGYQLMTKRAWKNKVPEEYKSIRAIYGFNFLFSSINGINVLFRRVALLVWASRVLRIRPR